MLSVVSVEKWLPLYILLTVPISDSWERSRKYYTLSVSVWKYLSAESIGNQSLPWISSIKNRTVRLPNDHPTLRVVLFADSSGCTWSEAMEAWAFDFVEDGSPPPKIKEVIRDTKQAMHEAFEKRNSKRSGGGRTFARVARATGLRYWCGHFAELRYLWIVLDRVAFLKLGFIMPLMKALIYWIWGHRCHSTMKQSLITQEVIIVVAEK